MTKNLKSVLIKMITISITILVMWPSYDDEWKQRFIDIKSKWHSCMSPTCCISALFANLNPWKSDSIQTGPMWGQKHFFHPSLQEHKITNHIDNLPHNLFSLSSPFKGHQKRQHKTWIRLGQVLEAREKVQSWKQHRHNH